MLVKNKTFIIQYLDYKNVSMKMKIFKKINFFAYKYKRRITLLYLKRAKDYYDNNIEVVRKNMRDKYKNLSEEEREKMKNYQNVIEKK